MVKALGMLIVVLSMFPIAVPQPPGHSRDEAPPKANAVRDRARAVSVIVTCLDEHRDIYAHGSGVIIHKAGEKPYTYTILTAGHVALTNDGKPEKLLKLQVAAKGADSPNYRLSAKIFAIDKELDLALLTCKTLLELPVARIAREMPPVLGRVVAAGAPIVRVIQVEEGAFQGYPRETPNRALFGVAGCFGSSGGAIFNMHSEVLGIISQGTLPGVPGWSHGMLAVKLADIYSFVLPRVPIRRSV